MFRDYTVTAEPRHRNVLIRVNKARSAIPTAPRWNRRHAWYPGQRIRSRRGPGRSRWNERRGQGHPLYCLCQTIIGPACIPLFSLGIHRSSHACPSMYKGTRAAQASSLRFKLGTGRTRGPSLCVWQSTPRFWRPPSRFPDRPRFLSKPESVRYRASNEGW